MSNILDDEMTKSTGTLPKKEKRILWINVIIFAIITLKNFFLEETDNLEGVFIVIAMIGFFVMFLGLRITTTYWKKHIKKLNLAEKILLLFPLFNFFLLAFSSVTRIAN